MTSFGRLFDQALWDYDSEGNLVPPDAPALGGDPDAGFSVADRAQAALSVMRDVFGFNPHQLRGPDGRWIKMGTAERKSRRNERARARRAAKKEQAAPQAEASPDEGPSAERRFREARDRFDREMVDHGQFQLNDNEFEGVDDVALGLDLRALKAALVRGDDLEADEAADRLHHRLAQDYPHVDIPEMPDLAKFDPKEEARQKLRAALDSYNEDMHMLAQGWVDLLANPDEDLSYLGLDRFQQDQLLDALQTRVDSLKEGIEKGVPGIADRAAAQVRQILTVYGLQRADELEPLPTIADFDTGEAQKLIAPPRKSNPLLSTGAPYQERLAALERAINEGVWGRDVLGQGAMGDTKKLLLNDGTQVINKRAKKSWDYGGVEWTPRQQTDAEELSAVIGSALGLRAPAVQRVDEDTLNMEFIPDAVPAFNRFWDKDAPDQMRVPDDIMGSDDALRMGLFDALVGNPDRHGFNWMVDDENRLYPIDHGLAFVNLKGTNASDAGRSPFAREYFITPSGQFKDSILTKRDIAWVRQQLNDLQPEFERVGQPAWLAQALARLRRMEIHARGGNSHQLPAPREE